MFLAKKHICKRRNIFERMNKIKRAIALQQFGKMAGLLQNSTVFLQLNFCTKLNIFHSIPTSSNPETIKSEIKKPSIFALMVFLFG